MIREHFRVLSEKLLEACHRVYGDRLVTVAVFGSVARGTPGPESDVDVLIVARDLPHGRLERMAEFRKVEVELASLIKAMATEGIATDISPVFKTPEQVEVGSLLFLDMIEDAVILYDESEYFRKHLDKLAARLKDLGARKIKRGGQWHWDLKPDYRPGEVFDL
ncbi:MAG: nucleotidyltransferase domain-containing protein [Bacillota bacterium]